MGKDQLHSRLNQATRIYEENPQSSGGLKNKPSCFHQMKAVTADWIRFLLVGGFLVGDYYEILPTPLPARLCFYSHIRIDREV